MPRSNKLNQTITILIIDDDSAVRTWLAEVLTQEGYTVRAASDGSAAAPDELRSSPIDLLITDIVMPGQEGIETIQAVRREFPQLKIIAMSGANTVYLKIATRLGANATLTKPFSIAELLLTVRYLVG